MDPTPQSHPILAYVLSRLPSLLPVSPSLSTPRARDIEQPSPRAPSGAAEFDLVSRMPGLRHPSVLSAMTRAVADVSSARDALRLLGPRPDHELVDSARAFLRSHAAEEAEEEEEDEKVAKSREVVRLDEAHESYGGLLREAEERLDRVYRTAMRGRDMQVVAAAHDGGGEEEAGVVDDEVVRVLRDAEEGKAVERLLLADRQLRHLPEQLGRIRGLLVLDVSRNQLKVLLIADLFLSFSVVIDRQPAKPALRCAVAFADHEFTSFEI